MNRKSLRTLMTLIILGSSEVNAKNQIVSSENESSSKRQKMVLSSAEKDDQNSTALYDKDGNMYHDRDYRKSMKGGKSIW